MELLGAELRRYGRGRFDRPRRLLFCRTSCQCSEVKTTVPQMLFDVSLLGEFGMKALLQSGQAER